jgi:hypothetical protein
VTSTAPPSLPLDADLLCHRCHQNLRGVPDGRCPECGETFDRDHVLSGAIPWESRHRHATFRAFWRTVCAFTFKPRRITAAAIEHSPHPRAALLFRRRAVLLGGLGSAAALALLYCLPQIKMFTIGRYELPRPWPLLLDWISDVRHLIVAMIGLPIGLMLWCELMSIPFRRLPQGERALAMSYYAAAPLAWLLPGFTLVLVAALVREFLRVIDRAVPPVALLYDLASIVWLAWLIPACLTPLLMLSASSGWRSWRLALAVALLPIGIALVLICTLGPNALLDVTEQMWKLR